MKIIFFLLFVLIVYHYFLFPILTFFIATVRNLNVNQKEIFPTISLIIAAYNEEKVIKEKIINSFSLDYPKRNIEIIVVSDGSTDATPRIVSDFQPQGVIGLFSQPRKGKTSALNHAVSKATGVIIVFSDANSMYKKDALKMLVRNFHDLSVGGVCGRKSIIDNTERESSKGDNLFWNFESTLKTWQSQTGSISNGDGEIFALRRELYIEIPEEIINDDQIITFDIIMAGYRVVYEPEAVSYEEASIILEDDFKVKARMVTGGYQTIAYYKDVLFPPTSYFKFQFISHKVLRYIMPFILIALFICNIFFLNGFFFHFFIMQFVFYFAASFGYLLKKLNIKQGVFYIPNYYCIMNIAALFGLYYFITNKSGIVVWKKAKR